jgi:hypothetical protein
MEVSKVPPPDVATARAGASALTEQGSPSAPAIAAPADRADIGPLDISSALQILLSEVRAGLDLPPDAAIMQAPDQAARAVLSLFLQGLPENARDASAWTSELVRVEAAIQSSIERALGIVSQWRDVSAGVVDAVKEARALSVSVLGDDPHNPLWLRPEWLGLAPTMQRFRRRRRNAQRRLADPDYPTGSLDDGEFTARE